MTETEVERLVVRLVGDSTSYVKMLTDAQKKTEDAAKKVEDAASKIEKFQKNLEGFAGTTAKILGAVGITATLKGMYEQFDHADDSITELTSLIRANGREVSKLLPLYQDFAKEMAAVTTSSKGEIIELAKQTEALGLSGERAQKAIKNAITLGAVKGTDPSSFLRQTVNFEKTGNAAGIARVLGLMGEMEEDTTKAAEAAKLLEKDWELVITKGEDGGAKINRALNELKGLGKDAGEVISRNFEPLIVYLEKAAKWFKDIDPATRKTIATMVVLTASIYPAIVAYELLAPKIMAVATALKAVGLAAYANPLSAVAIIAVTAAFIALTYAVNKYNEAVKESNKLSQKMLDSTDRQMKSMTAFQKEDNRLNYERQLKDAKDKLESMQNKPALGSGAFGMGISAILPGAEAAKAIAGQLFPDADVEEQKRKVEELEALLKKYNDAKKSAQESIGPAGLSEETLKTIRDLNSDLTKQIETVGMSETEAKIYELRLKAVGDAAAQADLDVAEYNARMLEAAKAQRSAIDSAKDLAKSLELQAKTFGMTDREAAKVKMTMEGVDEETMKRVDNAYKEVEVLEAMQAALEWVGDSAEKTKEQYQALQGVLAGGASAAQLIYQYANQFGADTGAVNKAATLRRADFTAQPDRNFVGKQLQGADATKELEKKLDEQTKLLQQIRDKEGVTLEGADLTA